MNKRQTYLFVLLALLAGAAVYMFKDWFVSRPIQIEYAIRPAPAQRRPQAPGEEPTSGKKGYNIVFNLGQKLPLTSVKVISVNDALTNKYPRPIWHLISDSNAIPTQTLSYGGGIRGMHPAIKAASPEPLEPGGSYRLLIETKKVKAEKDFQIPR